jgi:hypothetical protein
MTIKLVNSKSLITGTKIIVVGGQTLLEGKIFRRKPE